MRNPLHAVFGRLSRRSTARTSRRPSAPGRLPALRLETLEGRVVPAITLTNGVLSITGDANPNAIVVNLSDSGAVDVSLDSQTAHFDAGMVNSVSVDGAGGTDSFTVNDLNTATGQTYTLTGTSINRSGAAPISYANVENIALNAGSHGNQINWQGTAANSLTTVNSGAGNDTINFGDANNTLDGFLGTPVIHAQGGTNADNVYDQGSTAAHTYVLTANSFSRDGGAGYGDGLQLSTYYLGSGGNTIDWQGTADGDTSVVYTGTGTNNISIGDANNTLNGFLGAPVVIGQGSNNTATVNDQGSTAAHTYVLTGNSISRDGGTGYYSGLHSLTFNGGSGGNTINWQGTASGTLTTVNAGAGDDTVNFGDANNTLDGFLGTPIVHGQGGTNTDNVFDQGSTAAHTYVLTANSLSRDGGVGYGDGLQAINIFLGSGGNTVDWQGTADGSVTTVFSGPGTNTVNVGDTNNTLDGFKGTPILVGQGSNNTLNVNDQGSTVAHTYQVTATAITRDGGAGFFSDVQTLNFNGGSGGNVINWEGTAAGSITTVNAGAGNDTVNFGDANNTLDGFLGTPIVHGQGGTNADNVHDEGSTVAHTYVITGTSLTRDGGTGYGDGFQTTNYYFGSGGNTINWQGTASGDTTTVYAGAGDDTINFGDANNTLDGFLGTPIVHGQGGTNTDNTFDQGSTVAHTYVLTADSLSRDGGVGYGDGLQYVNFYFGSGGNTINWQGTPAGSLVTVYAGAGNDTVNFGDANNTLDGFLGTPVVHGQGGTNTDNVFDQGSTAAHTYVITGTSLTRDGGTGYGDGLQTTNYYFGSGGNTINWQGTASGDTTTVYAGAGNDTVNFGDTHNTLDSFLGTPIVHGQGGTNTDNVFDQGSTVAHTYVITGTSLTRDGGTGYGDGFAATNYFFGSGGNTINWQGTEGNDTTTVHTGTGANTVSVGDGNNTLDGFLGTPILVGQGGNTTLTVNDQGSTTLHAYVITGSSISRDGSTGYYSGVKSLVFNGGAGGNTIDLQPTSATTTVNAGAGDDTITVGSTANTLDSYNGTVTIDGQGGNNSLNVNDQGSTKAHTYTLAATSLTRDGVSGFGANLETITYNFGSGGNKIIWLGTAAGTVSTVNAGAGNDTITFGDSHNTLDGFLGTPIVNGQGGTNRATVNDQGSTTAHSYVITANSLSRDGGAGFYSGLASLTFNAANGGSTTTVQSIPATTSITIKGGTGTNTLVGPDTTNNWRVFSTGGTLNNSVSFSVIQNLTGGAGADTFSFNNAAKVTGSINGGGGTNMLDFASYTTGVTVNLLLGTSTGVGGSVSNIANVRGGAGNNLFVGNALANTFTGAGGRDVVIGEGGADKFTGNADDDLLIAGSTSYDSNPAALNAIFAEWTRTDRTYQQRINDLHNGGGLNGGVVLDTTAVPGVAGTPTVFLDTAASVLTGGAGMDWFFVDLSHGKITDKAAGEVVN